MKILGLVLKGLKIMMIGLVIFAVVYIIYFATQMSATYPPLKTYDYGLTYDELYQKLANVNSSNPAWTFMITDSTGEVDNRRYYCQLYKRTPTDSLTFNIFFQKTDRLFDKRMKSEIGLVRAWDNIQWKGGYKMDDPEVEALVILFEDDIISKLQSNTSR